MLTLAAHSGALAARLSGSPIHLMNIDYWLWEQDPASCQEALDGNLSCLTVSMPVSGAFLIFLAMPGLTGRRSVCCHVLFRDMQVVKSGWTGQLLLQLENLLVPWTRAADS